VVILLPTQNDIAPLFEDRVIKMSYVNIGQNCSKRGIAVVLYDSRKEDESIRKPLSVIMKSEVSPANADNIGSLAKIKSVDYLCSGTYNVKKDLPLIIATSPFFITDTLI
jgi:hypothetical protein